MSLRSSRRTAIALVGLATFTDIVAYSIAVPVLPDLSRRLGASPTVVGLLFASFGLTLLTVSMPMGAISDRTGRKLPLVGGLVTLSAATLLFAFARTLPMLFAARLIQGAADAVTWVVGFALIADLYPTSERGRVTGLVMAATGFAFVIGPSLGGWLYEIGGAQLPFVAVAGLAAAGAAAFAWLDLPDRREAREPVPIAAVVRTPAVAICAAAVVAASATISMIEPVLALHLESALGAGPARIGLLFGVAAVATTALHPVFGRLADRFGARRLTMIGLFLTGCALVALGRAWSFNSAVALYVLQVSALALVITPSLAYMAEATTLSGLGSFGVAYGLYNVAWGAGLLGGPALGGFLLERIGFTELSVAWGAAIVLASLVLARVRSTNREDPQMTRARISTALIGALIVLTPLGLRADVRMDQKSHVQFAGALGKIVNFFGGRKAREGVTSTVAVKGDRKATFSDETGQIVDLSEEKVYDLDLKHKTYTVTTFAELRQKMADEQRRAQAQEQRTAAKPEKAEPPDKNAKQVDIDFDIKNTGETKTINGFDTHEVVMTITVREKGKTLEEAGGMVLTSDMWLTSRIAAMKDVVDFDIRYARQLAGPMVAGASPEEMAQAMAMYPMMKDAMARMRSENGRVDGTPILTMVTMDGVKSKEQMEEEQKNQSSEEGSSGSPGGLGGFLAKRLAKKRAESSGEDQNKARATFMTITNEVLKVAPAATAADVAIPEGFKLK